VTLLLQKTPTSRYKDTTGFSPSPEPITRSRLDKVLSKVEKEIARRQSSGANDISQDISSHKKLRRPRKNIVFNQLYNFAIEVDAVD